MSEDRQIYKVLRQEAKKQLLPYTLLRGQGGPLVFVWALGTGLLLVLPGGDLVYPLVWTGAMAVLGAGMTLGYNRSREVWKHLLQSIVARRFPRQKLSDAALQAGMQKGIDMFVESALKATEIERAHGEDPQLRRALADAYGMLSLQYESAQQAEEFERGLRLMESDRQGDGEPNQRLEEAEAARLHRENLAAIRKEAAQARSLAADICQQQETLMLRVFQLEKLPQVRLLTAALAQETGEILETIQAKVSLQKEAATVSGIDGDMAQSLADRHAPPELRQLREALEGGFSRTKSQQGLKTLRQLIYEYGQLQPFLERKAERASLSAAHVPPLAEETYRQGLSMLRDALELIQVTQAPDQQRLEAETIELEKEIEALRSHEAQGRRVKIKEETLSSHRERLELMQQQRLRVDELLHQAGRCEASLHRARIELAALKADISEGSVSEVTETLRKTINQAREVQEELNRLGY